MTQNTSVPLVDDGLDKEDNDRKLLPMSPKDLFAWQENVRDADAKRNGRSIFPICLQRMLFLWRLRRALRRAVWETCLICGAF